MQATVDRTVLSPDESLSLQVTIRDGSGDVDTSVIKDFDIISKSSGSNISIMNGSMTRTKEYTYTLIPRTKGALVIPALAVDTGDETLHTLPLKITVTQTQAAAADPGNGDVFLDASSSSKKGYIGQQIIYTVSVYQRVTMANAQLEQPDFTGCTADKVEEQKSFDTVKNGQSYRVTQVSYLLTPLEPGSRTIAPSILSCDIMRQDRRRSRLDSFFNNDAFFSSQRRVHKTFRSNPLALEILPLPSWTDTARSFSGLVGSFSLKATLDKTVLKTGESATLTVTVSGTGNIDDAGQPAFIPPENCKIYPDEPFISTQVEAAGTTGQKIFAFALVPTKPGIFSLPPVELNWFDPATDRYEQATISLAPLQVTQGTASPVPPVSAASQKKPSLQDTRGNSRQNVTILHKDILPMYDSVDGVISRAPLSLRGFGACMAVPLVLFFAVLLVRKKRVSSGHPSKMFACRAENLLKETRSAPYKNACSLCSKALMTALASRTHTLSESLTYDEAEEQILRSTGNRDLATRVRNLMLALDTARYGSGKDAAAQTATLIDQTSHMVREICA